MRAPWCLVVLAVAIAGCGGAPPQAPDGLGDGAIPPGQPGPALAFQPPVQVNAMAGEGYEPSLRVAPDGTVYVAAARGFPVGQAGDAVSPVWWSGDDGATWQELATPLGLREAGKTIEGDLAVDSAGNVYFVDTWGPDNAFTVWGPDRTMRGTRPVQGTLAADDRPWLAAHGDGVVYYVGNGIAPAPAPANPTAAARYWFYASSDHGTTWSLGHGFAGSGYCHVAASPADDQTVAVACIGPGVGSVRTPFVEAWHSRDRGATWVTDVLSSSPRDPGGDFPSASYDTAGALNVAWLEADGTLQVARRLDDAWTHLPPIAPDAATSTPWVAAGPSGRLAVAAYVLRPSGWAMEAWAFDGAGWVHAVADAGPLGVGPEPPQDFFQAAYDGAGLLHIAYQDDDPLGSEVPIQPYAQPILHVREAAPAPPPQLP